MIRSIRKRDGRVVSFDRQKITEAIYKAFRASGNNDPAASERITDEVVDLLEVLYKGQRLPSVEDVQDLVENRMIHNNLPEMAKRYIIYRERHAGMRETRKMIGDAVEMIDDYIKKLDWRINENSNMSFSLQGLNNGRTADRHRPLPAARSAPPTGCSGCMTKTYASCTTTPICICTISASFRCIAADGIWKAC